MEVLESDIAVICTQTLQALEAAKAVHLHHLAWTPFHLVLANKEDLAFVQARAVLSPDASSQCNIEQPLLTNHCRLDDRSSICASRRPTQ